MKTAAACLFLIEDDSHFRETIADVMSLRGVEVLGAGSAQEALRALERLDPSVKIAAIISDVNLPDGHGFELCRRIKRMEAFKKTPVIFLSASAQYNDPRDRVEGLLAGATVFLPKPIKMERLWSEIEPLLPER